ncbi:MAG TPA: hypothetical protein VMI56_04925 [Reyranella sp.]|nr:hypothetical protein [Reyranella sp.]
MRIVLGFIFAPLTPLLLLLAISLGTGGITLSQSFLMIFVGLPSVYVPAIVFGIPVFLVLRWRRWDGMMAYFGGGAAVGVMLCLVSVAVLALRHVDTGLFGRQARGLWPFLIACTLASSSVFWLIVRPDTFDAAVPELDPSDLPPPAA